MVSAALGGLFQAVNPKWVTVEADDISQLVAIDANVDVEAAEASMFVFDISAREKHSIPTIVKGMCKDAAKHLPKWGKLVIMHNHDQISEVGYGIMAASFDLQDLEETEVEPLRFCGLFQAGHDLQAVNTHPHTHTHTHTHTHARPLR